MNEFDFISKIAEENSLKNDGLILGIGDDAAVISGSAGKAYLVSTDALIEDVHFKSEWIDWFSLGRKSLLVNISDISAMGGKPLYYFVSIGIPENMSEENLMKMFSGMKKEAVRHEMVLAGGDTVAAPEKLFISVTIIGSAKKESVLYRSGAKPGDKIFVTGKIGSSSLGLECLKRNYTAAEFERFIFSHNVPPSRNRFGTWIAENGFASSMIDISDGIISDMNHIAGLSSAGYIIEADKVPYDKLLAEKSAAIGLNKWDYIFGGGEDYELLFTIKRDKEASFADSLKKESFNHAVTEIGCIKEDKTVKTILDSCGNRIETASKGFIHSVGLK